MSATLAVLLKELHPDFKIAIFEKLEQVAAESSDAWNNAGTGHAALCELNYTPEREDGFLKIYTKRHKGSFYTRFHNRYRAFLNNTW